MFFCKQTKYQFNCAATISRWSSKARRARRRFEVSIFNVLFCVNKIISHTEQLSDSRMNSNLTQKKCWLEIWNSAALLYVLRFLWLHIILCADSIVSAVENSSTLPKNFSHWISNLTILTLSFFPSFMPKRDCCCQTKGSFMHSSMRSHDSRVWGVVSCRQKRVSRYSTIKWGSKTERREWEEATNNTKI